MDIFLAVILGGLFGFALYFVGASNAKKILSMLRLQDLSLMKIILFAIGFSSVLLAIAKLVGIFDVSHLSVKATHLGVIIGGLIFGLGFGWVGTCPGTCVAASTSGGHKKAVVAILGGLLGAFAFSVTYDFWKEVGLFSIMNLGKVTLFNLSDKYPSVMDVGFVGLLVVGLLFMVMGYIIPQRPFNNRGKR